jgi:AraC-like DNA-binding protein
MDPLSEVLSLLKLQAYESGGFLVSEKSGLQFSKHQSLKCYFAVSGNCWAAIEGQDNAILLKSGDCIVVRPGRPFYLATDLTSPRVAFSPEITKREPAETISPEVSRGCSILGGSFHLAGHHSEFLLNALASIVHIPAEANKGVIRSLLECLREEFRNPQPGGSAIAQQLVYILLVQALRIHLQNETASGVGWLFALAEPRLRKALECIHSEPSHPWTIQDLADRAVMSRTVFAELFKKRVGMTSMQYLTHWRMLLAGDRLTITDESVSEIAQSIGYETESAFGKAFKRVQGRTPREYRLRRETT